MPRGRPTNASRGIPTISRTRRSDGTPKAHTRGAYSPGSSRGRGKYHQIPMVDLAMTDVPNETFTLDQYWDDFYGRFPDQVDHRLEGRDRD